MREAGDAWFQDQFENALKHRKVWLNVRKRFLSVKVAEKLAQVAQREWGGWRFLKNSKAIWTWSWAASSERGGGADQMATRGPFQFSRSVVCD